MKANFIHILTLVSLVFLSTCPIGAKTAMTSLYDLTAQSNLIVQGKVLQVAEKSARIKVATVLKGILRSSAIIVTPVTTTRWGEGMRVNYRTGEEVVLLLQGTKNPFTVVSSGAGKISLTDPRHREDDLAAIKRLITITGLKTEDARNKAMLATVTAKNPRLQVEASSYLIMYLANSPLRMNYKASLLKLLRNPDDRVSAAALFILQKSRDPQALPLIIAISERSNAGIVSQACDALMYYETAAATDALIALAANPNPEIRGKVALNLGRCQQPGAFQVASTLLNDSDDHVRSLAVIGLIEKFRAHKADKLIPRLLAMLNGPGNESQLAAAKALGESASIEAALPLLTVLDRPELSTDMECSTISALYVLYNLNLKAQNVIKTKLEKIIYALDHSNPSSAFQAFSLLAAARTPEALAALKRAAEMNPDAEVRFLAKRALTWK